jgi:hypothetical protein
MLVKSLLVVVLFGLLLSPASASCKPGTVSCSPRVVLGVGTTSCALFNKASVSTKEVVISWLLGYVTATIDADRLRGRRPALVREVVTPGQTFDIWLSQYCSAYPDSNVGDAALALVIELPRTK